MAHSSHSSRRVSRGTCRSCSCSCNWRRRMNTSANAKTNTNQAIPILSGCSCKRNWIWDSPPPLPLFLGPVPPVCACKLANMCVSYISVYTCIYCRYVCVCLHGYYVFRCLFISFNEMCKQLQKLAVVEQRTAKKMWHMHFYFYSNTL